MSKLNGIMICPTGLSVSLGGDASFLPGAKLIASCCDKLIGNPNLFNASDINEMTDNSLYVEGSTIDRFISGEINLKETKTNNKILCVVNPPILPGSINAVNAGIWGLGANIELLELKVPLIMNAKILEDNSASGDVIGWESLVDQVKELDFDILTIHTPINCDPVIANKYWNGEITTNPWGAVEAMLSKLVSKALNKQAVHSPIDFLQDNLYNKLVVKQSQAPEIISNTYAFCMFKGAHKAPKIDITVDSKNLSYKDIDFLISPKNCWGTPHEQCFKKQIPIIIVEENETCFKEFKYPEYALNNRNVIFINNHLEAAGILMCMNAGIDYSTVLV